MRIKNAVLYHVRLPLKHYFETSFGRVYQQDHVVLEIETDAGLCYGEAPVGERPDYSHETAGTAMHVLKDFIIPSIGDKEIKDIDELMAAYSWIRGHNMAKMALESAFWNWNSLKQQKPLKEIFKGVRDYVEVGVSLGIHNSPKELMERVEAFLSDGYRRIKVKIKPGWDIKILSEIRKSFGMIPLTVDANAAYTLDDMEHLRKLDDFGLIMIEQPFHYEDLADHAKLQAVMSTSICLDESITSLESTRHAMEMESCRIVNIKPARVGGLWISKLIESYVQRYDCPVWCGGLLEFGIGRAYNVAVASLPNFLLPGDISGSSRYYEEDIVDPPMEPVKGLMKVPDVPGLGVNVRKDRIEKYCVNKIVCEI